MSQRQPSFTERLRRALSPGAQDELDQMTAVQDDAACERDRAEELFRRLRGPAPSHRPAWENIAGMDGREERRP